MDIKDVLNEALNIVEENKRMNEGLEDSILDNAMSNILSSLSINENTDVVETSEEEEEDNSSNDFDIEDVDLSSDEDEMSSVEDDEEDTDIEIDMDTDTDIDSDGMEDSSEEIPTPIDLNVEDETIDMSNATEEEVMDMLSNIPDSEKVTFTIKKEPRFNVEMDDNINMDMGVDTDMEIDTEIDFDDSDMDDNMGDDMDTEVDIDMDVEDTEEVDENTMLESLALEMDINRQKQLNEISKKKVTTSGNSTSNISLLREVAKLRAENTKLKRDLASKDSTLGEAASTINKILVENKKLNLKQHRLAEVVSIFSQYSTTGAEKLNIIRKLEEADSAKSCKLVGKLLRENLNKRKPKSNKVVANLKGRNKLTEQATTVKENKKQNKKILSEEQGYINVELDRVQRLMTH